MHQQFDIQPEEGRRAKWPHEIFLINLIFNHIFMFCATVAVIGSFPYLPALVPVVSFSIIGYIFLKARQIAVSSETWFVKAHWQIAARRNRIFMLLLAITCVISGGGLWLSKMMGWAKIPTIALIGGVGLLPFMAVLLVLIVLGNESLYMARDGKLPNRYGKNATTIDDESSHTRFPLPNPLPQAGEGTNESLRDFHVKRFIEQNPGAPTVRHSQPDQE